MGGDAAGTQGWARTCIWGYGVSDDIYLLDDSQSVVRQDGKEVTSPRVRAVAVLFLSSGRNAWHRTWVKRYSRGSFFRDGRAVDLAVDKRKTPGTVFYLTVLPAFVFCFGSRHFLATEINTTEPFRHIDLGSARNSLMGRKLADFLDAMLPSSSLWKPQQSRANSIIVQEVSEDYIDLATYTVLSKGQDKGYNPPMGSYRRQITGTVLGETEWHWEEMSSTGRTTKVSMRWYNRALEALAEGRERLHGWG